MNQLNSQYQNVKGLTGSDIESIAWTGIASSWNVIWNANEYAPDLEFNINTDYKGDEILVTTNSDKRGGVFGYRISCRNNNVPSTSMTCDNLFFSVPNATVRFML